MGIKAFEKRLEQMVEGTFARMFKSDLRPVEVARRLTREMDNNRSIGVSGETIVPNHFYVYVSEADFARLSDVQETMSRELAEAVREHARDEAYSFKGPVVVELHPAPGYPTGTFQITPQLREGPGGRAAGSLVLPSGERMMLADEVVTIGRLPESTVALTDPNVSRRHAEIRPTAAGYEVVDVGSTNGTKVNGRKVMQQQLTHGDQLDLGGMLFRFEVS